MGRELDEYGFTDLTGLDYAAGSVKLAANICKDLSSVKVEQADILNLDEKFVSRFHVAIDKGTLDAISLTPEDKAAALSTYSRNVAKMLNCKKFDKCYLLITSCNWTAEELKEH